MSTEQAEADSTVAQHGIIFAIVRRQGGGCDINIRVWEIERDFDIYFGTALAARLFVLEAVQPTPGS